MVFPVAIVRLDPFAKIYRRFRSWGDIFGRQIGIDRRAIIREITAGFIDQLD